MLERKTQPVFRNINKINYQKPDTFTLSNGVPVFAFFAESDKIIGLEIIFNAGVWFQPKVLLASTTNAMLREGTQLYTSGDISEKLDFFGAHLSAHVEKDKAVVGLYCPHKHFSSVLKILTDIVMHPIFPQNELDILIKKRKEQYKIDSKKVKTLAQRKLNKVLFSNNHPYGQIALPSDFDNVTRNQLVDFHNKTYNANNCKIIVSGYIDDEVKSLINILLGVDKWHGNYIHGNNPISPESEADKIFRIEHKQNLQSAIQVGAISINRKHPDFMELRFLNILLGGYFGSRLMSNIREDKGYTYGIHSMFVSMQHSGFFSISTEVGCENTDATIEEISREIKKLREVKIPTDELDRVKNYFIGNTLNSFDGPLATADSFRTIIDYKLPFSYFDQYISKVLSLEPPRLLELANKYLDFEKMKIVVAG